MYYQWNQQSEAINLELCWFEWKKKCFLSVNESYKYFIGCKDDYYETKLLSIILLRASAYVKSYDDETKWVHLLIEDGDLLQKYKKSLG